MSDPTLVGNTNLLSRSEDKFEGDDFLEFNFSGTFSVLVFEVEDDVVTNFQ